MAPNSFHDYARITGEASEPITFEPESDTKLRHRWILADVDTGTVTDSVGSADGTVNGVSPVTGDWIDDGAGDADGSNDNIETTTLGTFGSTFDTDIAVAFTIKTTSLGQFGCFWSDNPDDFIIGNDFTTGAEGGPFLWLVDADDNTIREQSDRAITDGNKYRVVLNKTGNNATDIEIWINGRQVSTSTAVNESYGNPTDLEQPFTLFARKRNDGTNDKHWNAVMDDICLYEDSLTNSEIRSYEIPWGILYDEKEVLSKDPNKWYSDGVRPVSIVDAPDSADLWLYFEGMQSGSKPFQSSIGIATSSDGGATWSIDSGKGKVLDVDDYSISNAIRGLSVVPPARSDDSNWHAYFIHRTSGSDTWTSEIWHATSSDGVNWSDDSNNPLWDTDDPFHASVYQENGTWYLFTSEAANTPQDLFRISSGSMDATNWGNRTVVLSPGSDIWESYRVREPDLSPKGDGWELWYTGVQGDSVGEFEIGRLTSDSLTGPWSRDADNPYGFGDINYPLLALTENHSDIAEDILLAQSHNNNTIQYEYREA